MQDHFNPYQAPNEPKPLAAKAEPSHSVGGWISTVVFLAISALNYRSSVWSGFYLFLVLSVMTLAMTSTSWRPYRPAWFILCILVAAGTIIGFRSWGLFPELTDSFQDSTSTAILLAVAALFGGLLSYNKTR